MKKLIYSWVLGMGMAAGALAQENGGNPGVPMLQWEEVPFEVDSGWVANDTRDHGIIFQETISVPGAEWLRLSFDEVLLAAERTTGRHGEATRNESFLIMTSLLDEGYQTLRSEHVEQWQHHSAYFNGDTVLLQIYAYPGTGLNRVKMSKVEAGLPMMEPETICGPTDDRLPSQDKRVARNIPGTCTAWLIDDPAHCLLTAGHCSGSASSVEFNYPLSNGSGQIVRADPKDQYAIDPASMQSNGGQGTGNDYAYFGVFPNPITGKTPFEAQGEFFTLIDPPDVNGQNIRITGNGSTGGSVPPEYNLAQKTHVGPYFQFTGTTVRYQTDTSGGNSGSPIILDGTGNAIGIHTHGGCTSSGGSNIGTGANLPAFKNAIANPRGVCAAPPVCGSLSAKYKGTKIKVKMKGYAPSTSYATEIRAADGRVVESRTIVTDGSGKAKYNSFIDCRDAQHTVNNTTCRQSQGAKGACG